MGPETLHIGGRKSKLAVIQSNHVLKLIEEKYPDYDCKVFTLQTLGDQIQFKPLYSFGGKALWTKELEDHLYHDDPSKKLDLIVHSLKDMPTLLPEGFELGVSLSGSIQQIVLSCPFTLLISLWMTFQTGGLWEPHP